MNQTTIQKTISILTIFAKYRKPSLSLILQETQLPRTTVMNHFRILKEEYNFQFRMTREKNLRYYKVVSWGVFDRKSILSLDFTQPEASEDVEAKSKE